MSDSALSKFINSLPVTLPPMGSRRETPSPRTLGRLPANLNGGLRVISLFYWPSRARPSLLYAESRGRNSTVSKFRKQINHYLQLRRIVELKNKNIF
jgi:hypothetical protein